MEPSHRERQPRAERGIADAFIAWRWPTEQIVIDRHGGEGTNEPDFLCRRGTGLCDELGIELTDAYLSHSDAQDDWSVSLADAAREPSGNWTVVSATGQPHLARPIAFDAQWAQAIQQRIHAKATRPEGPYVTKVTYLVVNVSRRPIEAVAEVASVVAGINAESAFDRVFLCVLLPMPAFGREFYEVLRRAA